MKVVINVCHGGFGISEEAKRILLLTLGEDGFNEMERHDPIFVSLVENMGKAVNNEYSKLAIVNVEDGLDYDVEEYDGYESIREYLSVFEDGLRNGLSEEKLALLKYTNEIRVKY